MESGLELGVLAGAFGLGLRHGVDWDHLAAIADLSSSSASPRRGLARSTLYALGHATVVLALGVVAITVGARLPTWVDEVMQPLVSASLVGFGVYLAVSLVRHGRDARLRSRWLLLFDGLRRLGRHGAAGRERRGDGDGRVVVIEHDHPPGRHHGAAPWPEAAGEPSDPDAGARIGRGPATPRQAAATSHRHVHVVSLPDDPFTGRGSWGALGLGMLHGVGVETPTQIIVLATAAGAGAGSGAVAFLVVFLSGLVCSNTLVALAAAAGVVRAARASHLFVAVGWIAALASVAIGLAMLSDAV